MGSLPMDDILSMNPFDAAVYVCLFVAAVMGSHPACCAAWRRFSAMWR
jgi:hypothetical protein